MATAVSPRGGFTFIRSTPLGVATMVPSAQVWFYFFLHIGVILVVCAYYALSAAIAPQMTHRARLRFAKYPWLPALIGVAISLPWVIASILLLRAHLGPVKFTGAVIGSAWILCGLIGGDGMAQSVGLGSSGDQPSWIHSVRGGLFITLTWVLPLIGWLVMLPLTLATGIGCLILGLFPMRLNPSHANPIAPLVDPQMTQRGLAATNAPELLI